MNITQKEAKSLRLLDVIDAIRWVVPSEYRECGDDRCCTFGIAVLNHDIPCTTLSEAKTLNLKRGTNQTLQLGLAILTSQVHG